MDTLKLEKKITWSGRYRGIPFEICHWGRGVADPRDTERFCHNWNYYIYVYRSNFADVTQAKTIFSPAKVKNYYNNPISRLDFHGGCTYIDYSGVKKDCLKVGCDYGHLYDEPEFLEHDDLCYDVKNTIDLLHNRFKLLIWNYGDGKFIAESDGKYNDEAKSSFISFEYIAKQQLSAKPKAAKEGE